MQIVLSQAALKNCEKTTSDLSPCVLLPAELGDMAKNMVTFFLSILTNIGFIPIFS